MTYRSVILYSFVNNNNNNNSHDNVYGAVIMTQSHCESSPGSSDECRLFNSLFYVVIGLYVKLLLLILLLI